MNQIVTLIIIKKKKMCFKQISVSKQCLNIKFREYLKIKHQSTIGGDEFKKLYCVSAI